MKVPIGWLLEGEPWIEYRTRRDLLGQQERHAQVSATRQAMFENAQVQNVLSEPSRWPGKVISNHKGAGQPFHKLTLLSSQLDSLERLGIWSEERAVSMANFFSVAYHSKNRRRQQVVIHTRLTLPTPTVASALHPPLDFCNIGTVICKSQWLLLRKQRRTFTGKKHND